MNNFYKAYILNELDKALSPHSTATIKIVQKGEMSNGIEQVTTVVVRSLWEANETQDSRLPH